MEMMAEKGINYIDSARGYTVSESFIGEGIEGMREKICAGNEKACLVPEKLWQRILRRA